MTLSKIRVTKKSQFSFYKSLGGSDRLQKLFNIPNSSLELINYEFVTKKWFPECKYEENCDIWWNCAVFRGFSVTK